MFRQEALDRLSSPEQLDQIIRTTSARGWLVLLTLCVFLAGTIAWGLIGSVATRVRGDGILIKSGGVLDVVSLGAGQITALYADVGQEVQRGEIVARIAQPELSEQIEKARGRMAELEAQHQKIASLGSSNTQALAGYAAQERSTLVQSMDASRERLAYLQKQEAEQRQLADKGLVTRQALEATRAEIRGVSESIERASGQIRGLSVSTGEARGNKERELLASELRISEVKREIGLLEERLELTSRVISPHGGRVLEVRAREGDLVSPGRSILSLEPAGSEGSGLEAVLFVPLAQGKTVKPGMRVQISPDSVKKEEHGVMLGIVTKVSEFPATEEGMKRVLENDLLVRKLLDGVGLAPIAVTAELVPDVRTDSGYRWSSGRGPPTQLGPGTPCRAKITVDRVRPIELVIPLLKETIGV
jgi:HlyD family secretion protein